MENLSECAKQERSSLPVDFQHEFSADTGTQAGSQDSRPGPIGSACRPPNRGIGLAATALRVSWGRDRLELVRTRSVARAVGCFISEVRMQMVVEGTSCGQRNECRPRCYQELAATSRAPRPRESRRPKMIKSGGVWWWCGSAALNWISGARAGA
jgi:hypothetical protein